MNVKQLKEQLEKYPDDIDVFVGERQTDFTYGLVNSVYVTELCFVESPNDFESLAEIDCLIISEE